MVMTTRVATFADAESITRIYNQGIEERIATFETELRSLDQVRAILEEKGDHHPAIVVERDGEVIAFAWASSYRSRPCYAGVAEHSVYVDRNGRGVGAGLLALNALAEAFAARGYWKLLSRIFTENEASLRLHQRAGFREVGVYHRHAKLDGVWRDTVIVEKLLGAAAE